MFSYLYMNKIWANYEQISQVSELFNRPFAWFLSYEYSNVDYDLRMQCKANWLPK